MGLTVCQTPASEGWYHRHGYWATRRKIINFGTKRHVRVEGPGGGGKFGWLILGFRWFVESIGE